MSARLSATRGSAEITIGNVLGSNICDIALILGLPARVQPLEIVGNTIRLEYPVMALVIFLALVFGRDGVYDRLDGIFCIFAYFIFITYLVILVRQLSFYAVSINQDDRNSD